MRRTEYVYCSFSRNFGKEAAFVMLDYIMQPVCSILQSFGMQILQDPTSVVYWMFVFIEKKRMIV